MAEWSKAPDLRSSVECEIAMVEEFGYSGLLVEAWVRIPLLTESFCKKLRFIQMADPKENLLSIDFGVVRSQGIRHHAELSNKSNSWIM